MCSLPTDTDMDIVACLGRLKGGSNMQVSVYSVLGAVCVRVRMFVHSCMCVCVRAYVCVG